MRQPFRDSKNIDAFLLICPHNGKRRDKQRTNTQGFQDRYHAKYTCYVVKTNPQFWVLSIGWWPNLEHDCLNQLIRLHHGTLGRWYLGPCQADWMEYSPVPVKALLKPYSYWCLENAVGSINSILKVKEILYGFISSWKANSIFINDKLMHNANQYLTSRPIIQARNLKYFQSHNLFFSQLSTPCHYHVYTSQHIGHLLELWNFIFMVFASFTTKPISLFLIRKHKFAFHRE